MISNPFRSETIVGIAVETMVPSIAVIKVVKKIAIVTILVLLLFCMLTHIIFQSFYFISMFPR